MRRQRRSKRQISNLHHQDLHPTTTQSERFLYGASVALKRIHCHSDMVRSINNERMLESCICKGERERERASERKGDRGRGRNRDTRCLCVSERKKREKKRIGRKQDCQRARLIRYTTLYSGHELFHLAYLSKFKHSIVVKGDLQTFLPHCLDSSYIDQSNNDLHSLKN